MKFTNLEIVCILASAYLIAFGIELKEFMLLSMGGMFLAGYSLIKYSDYKKEKRNV
jgi:hypothetical protein